MKIIKQNEIDIISPPMLNELLAMIVEDYLKFDHTEISKPIKDASEIPQFKRYLEVEFDDETCADEGVPKF